MRDRKREEIGGVLGKIEARGGKQREREWTWYRWADDRCVLLYSLHIRPECSEIHNQSMVLLMVTALPKRLRSGLGVTNGFFLWLYLYAERR